MTLLIVDEAEMPPRLDGEIRAGLCACFPADAAVFRQSRAWHGSAPQYSVVLEEADRVVAHVGVVDRTVAIGGEPLRVAGVQNVYVLPQRRGHGFSAHVLIAAMAEATRRGFDCGLLFCVPSLAEVYARCGWQEVSDRQVIRIEDGREHPLPGENIAMFYPIRKTTFPAGLVHLGGNDW